MAEMEADNMATEMTPQERAAALLDSIVGIIPMQPSQREARIEWLVEFAQATRRAALLEAAEKIRERGNEYLRDCEAKDARGKRYRDTCDMRRVNSGRAWALKDLADELARLASEGG